MSARDGRGRKPTGREGRCEPCQARHELFTTNETVHAFEGCCQPSLPDLRCLLALQAHGWHLFYSGLTAEMKGEYLARTLLPPHQMTRNQGQSRPKDSSIMRVEAHKPLSKRELPYIAPRTVLGRYSWQ